MYSCYVTYKLLVRYVSVPEQPVYMSNMYLYYGHKIRL